MQLPGTLAQSKLGLRDMTSLQSTQKKAQAMLLSQAMSQLLAQIAMLPLSKEGTVHLRGQIRPTHRMQQLQQHRLRKGRIG